MPQVLQGLLDALERGRQIAANNRAIASVNEALTEARRKPRPESALMDRDHAQESMEKAEKAAKHDSIPGA